jgi:hypothetical protein
LIHPFFSTANLGHKRAKKFKSLLDVLIHLAPASATAQANRTVLDDLEKGNREVLYSLTSALAASEEEAALIARYIDDFFLPTGYPPKVSPL